MNIPQSLPVPYHPSMEIQDSTKIQAYQDCPRMYFYEYVLGWRSGRPNNHLHFGKCLHLAMEHIILHNYTADSIMQALDIFNSEYRFVFPSETDALYSPKTPDRFFSMMLEYLQKYANDPLLYEVYKTEFGGTVALDDRHKIAFKMDTVLRNRKTDRYGSLEHKSKGGNYIGDNYYYEHAMGIQVGTYTHVLNCLVPPEQVDGVTINCMCFKKTKKAEFILQRFPIMLSNAQMLIWYTTVINWIDQIEADFHRLAETRISDDIMKCFPMNGRACCDWGRTCTYLDCCQSYLNPLQHQERIPADFITEFWNPLEDENLKEILDL